MLLKINNLTFPKRLLLIAILTVALEQVCASQTPPAQTPPNQVAPAPAQSAAPQNMPKLTLQQAEAIAIQNHPQVQAAQNEVNYSNQLIVESRSSYYPMVTGDLTGSQGNNLARIGAGDIAASRLFDRVSPGAVVRQLITDSGRTSNLVASSRLQAQATAQNSQATRYDVLLQVNRAYFDVLHAQAVVKVAEQTVSARQLLSDQVTELARNNLRSQLDVSFADVNVSEAKLLLVRAQDAVQQTLAELGRAMGSDQPANYQLAEESLPASPPATTDQLVVQALSNRPELAGLRFSRDAAYKFADAEKDLSRPTVSAIAVAGLNPYINTPPTSPIPLGYEGIAANVSIPVFNGHLFSARREAAVQRAMESDQRLRDEQQRLARDVRVAWASATDAYQRIDVTAQFLRQAALALDLAHGRYDLGLSSIVELTQAELNLTQAEIENLNAKYDYQTQYSALQYTIGLLR
jgi:outer membrane protein